MFSFKNCKIWLLFSAVILQGKSRYGEYTVAFLIQNQAGFFDSMCSYFFSVSMVKKGRMIQIVLLYCDKSTKHLMKVFPSSNLNQFLKVLCHFIMGSLEHLLSFFFCSLFLFMKFTITHFFTTAFLQLHITFLLFINHSKLTP